jgi:hypothetical protein
MTGCTRPCKPVITWSTNEERWIVIPKTVYCSARAASRDLISCWVFISVEGKLPANIGMITIEIEMMIAKTIIYVSRIIKDLGKWIRLWREFTIGLRI